MSSGYSQAIDAYPYYSIVPKDKEKNLLFRRNLIVQAQKSRNFAVKLRRMCAADPFFWINAFVWTYNPHDNPKRQPFITYDYQDYTLLELLKAKGFLNEEPHDLVIEKSRDMGATWLCILADLWAWHFTPLFSALWASRKETLVDAPDNPDSLFWKALFALKHEPGFIRPPFEKKKLHLLNLANKAVIDGESTNQDLSRGGRRSTILLDEFAAVPNGEEILAATADASPARIFNSTAKGANNAFYFIRQSGTKVIRLHWSVHPIKGKDKYIDKETGKWRSPWYNRECARRGSPLEIAQELDIEYHTAGKAFFDMQVLDLIEETQCKPPTKTGELQHEERNDRINLVGFQETPGGCLSLWCELEGGRPPQDRTYCIGVDVATGVASSPSTAAVFDVMTNEKVAEYANPLIPPEKFAEYVFALAEFFHTTAWPLLIFETNGPGAAFEKRITELRYPRLFYENTSLANPKIGWHTSRETKLMLLGNLRTAYAKQTIIERSHKTIKEARNYVYSSGGWVDYNEPGSLDRTEWRHNHGDRVIATALAVWVLQKTPSAVERPKKSTPPPSSFAARRLEYLKQRREKVEEAVWT